MKTAEQIRQEYEEGLVEKIIDYLSQRAKYISVPKVCVERLSEEQKEKLIELGYKLEKTGFVGTKSNEYIVSI